MKIFFRLILIFFIFFGLISGTVQWLSALQFYQGKKFYENKDWTQALEAFQRSCSLFPHHPETYRWLANTYLHLLENRNPETQLKLLKKAENALLIALSIEPKYPYYWALLGRVEEQILERRETPKKSPLFCYHQALLIDPHNPFFLELMAKFYLKNGNPESAKPLIAKIAKIEPYFIGEPLKLWLAKKYKPEELIPLFSYDIKALGGLQEFFSISQRHQSAIRAGEKAMELAPDNPEAVLIYGRALARSGDCKKAEPYLAPMFQDPKYEETARAIYLNCLLRTRQYKQAEEQQLRLIALQPKSIEYRLDLAQTYLFLKQPNLAKAHLLWAINQPNFKNKENNLKARTFLNLAHIFENEKNFAQAFKFYKLYLEIHPENQQVRAKLDLLKVYQPEEIIYSPLEKEKIEEETVEEIIIPPINFGGQNE